jgi:hypothetical protein
MMWFSLRTGFANTAAIAALALLPLVSVAATMLKSGSEHSRVDKEPIGLEKVVWQAEPFLAHFME